jgi:PBP1b-binding outer membrane lipoprotein LpoB
MVRKREFLSIVILSVAVGCSAPPASQAPAGEAPASPATSTTTPAAAETTAASAATAEELSMKYMEAAAALGVDNFEQARSALAALAKESSGELQKLAQTAADTGQLAAMREAFKPLSEAAAKMKLPAEYAVAFCPMYKGGSRWVQKKTDAITNPYYGFAMQTCGSFVN